MNKEQLRHLEKITSSGKVPARQIKRAQNLLKSDVQTNWPYQRIMEAFDVSDVTIAKVRKTSVKLGYADSISYETIRRGLEKTSSDPG